MLLCDRKTRSYAVKKINKTLFFKWRFSGIFHEQTDSNGRSHCFRITNSARI